MGSKVCRLGSLYQTWVRTTTTQIVYYIYRMEELITLYYGNLLSLERGQKISPGTPVVPTASLIELWEARSCLTNWRGNTQAGLLPTSKSGDSSYWGICSTMQPLWRRKSIEGTPRDHRMRKPKKWSLNTPPWGPLRCHWWHYYSSGQTSLLRGVDLCSQHAFPLSAWWLHEGIVAGVEHMYGQGWPTRSTKFDENLQE